MERFLHRSAPAVWTPASYRESMARKHRTQVAGGLYHIVARGNRRQPIFAGEDDRQSFAALLAHVVGRFGWECQAHCLMTNHYHLAIHTSRPNIGRGMARLNAIYAQSFNRRHGYCGHLFQDRYWSALVESDTHRLELMRYIVLNPVRAGLCHLPHEWSWSSYAATVGTTPGPAFLNTGWVDREFGPQGDPVALYRSFVLEGLESPIPPSADPTAPDQAVTPPSHL
jgi:putative transposase